MDISLHSIKKNFSTILQRFHVVIFSLIVLGSLVVVVFLLNTIVVQSSEKQAVTKTTTIGGVEFDQETINRINQLKTRDEQPEPLNFSGSRSNPFSEE